MHEHSDAVRMKSIGPNLTMPPDGDLPQVQICNKRKLGIMCREVNDSEGENND